MSGESLIAISFLYLFPAIIGLLRVKKTWFAIFLLNLLLGWTVFGWIGALIWAVMPEPSNEGARSNSPPP